MITTLQTTCTYGRARLVGYTEAKANKLAPFLAAARQPYPEEYWYHIWTSVRRGSQEKPTSHDSCQHSLSESTSSYCNHQYFFARGAHEEADIFAGCSKLRRAEIPVFVAQGTADEVIAPEVPWQVGNAMEGGVCDILEMGGYGHRGHPTDPEAEFLPEACAAAGDWLGLVHSTELK